MSLDAKATIVRYYDYHMREGEELTESTPHVDAIIKLYFVLRWLYWERLVGVALSLRFYQTQFERESPLGPDLAIVDGLLLGDDDDGPGISSYHVNVDGPPPRVVFEISSRETWDVDLKEKPARYRDLGVSEYFAFDPNRPTIWTKTFKTKGRLLGWRLDEAGEYQELEKDAQGRLWSVELDSWLAVDGKYLRLYTADGQLRLSREEFIAEQKEVRERELATERRLAAEERRQLLAERRRAEAEQKRAEAEQKRAEVEQKRAEEERRQRLAEQKRAEVAQQKAVELEQQRLAAEQELARLKELMRQQGFDPDKLN